MGIRASIDYPGAREADKIVDGSCRLLEILIAILLEMTTKKTSKISSIPSSQTDKDETRNFR